MTQYLDRYFKVLDHGFVALKDFMGDDLSIERAARVSCGKGTRPVSDTHALIGHLCSENPPHMSPTEACILEFHIQLPLFIQTQLLRYRLASPNVYSGRYSEMPELFYYPPEVSKQSKNNKQGSGEKLSPEDSEYILGLWQEQVNSTLGLYKASLAGGVAKEQARIILPYNVYSKMYWRIHLRNLFHLLEERIHPGAQAEIQTYAEVLGGIAKEVAPITFKYWQEWQFESLKFTKKELKALIAWKSYSRDDLKESFEQEFLDGHTKRQIRNFWTKLEHMDNTDHNFDLSKFEVLDIVD